MHHTKNVHAIYVGEMCKFMGRPVNLWK